MTDPDNNVTPIRPPEPPAPPPESPGSPLATRIDLECKALYEITAIVEMVAESLRRASEEEDSAHAVEVVGTTYALALDGAAALLCELSQRLESLRDKLRGATVLGGVQS
jgi:hypothetical protein